MSVPRKKGECRQWPVCGGERSIRRTTSTASIAASCATSAVRTRFLAFTDDPSGLETGIEPRAIPPIRLPATGLGGSPWRKLALWSRDIGVAGDMLFLDLDVVVVGSIDAFFDFESGKLALIRDWSATADGNSSVMRVPEGGAQHLIDGFEAAPLEKRRLYSNEQVYLTRESRLPTVFWPTEWCPGFKAMMLPRFPANLVKNVKLPEGARNRGLHGASAAARSRAR